MSEDIKDIIEILELAKEDIENNNENITATLDLQDLKSLKNLLDLYQKEKEKNLLKEEYNKGYFQGRRDERDETDKKIKELIKEIDDNNTDGDWWYINKIEELLEERNK